MMAPSINAIIDTQVNHVRSHQTDNFARSRPSKRPTDRIRGTEKALKEESP